MTAPLPPTDGREHLLEAFQEIGRSLEIGRTADTILAGLRHVLPSCDRATLCAVGLDGQILICRRVRGRDSALPETAAAAEELPDGGIARKVLDSGRPERVAVTPERAASDPDLSAASGTAVAAPLLGAGSAFAAADPSAGLGARRP